MPVTASLIGGGLSTLGSVVAGGSAASEASRSARRATDEQRRQFNTALGLQMPGIQAGDAARNQLLALLGLPQTGGSSGQFGGTFSNLSRGKQRKLGRLQKLRDKGKRFKEQSKLERQLGLQPGQDITSFFDAFPTSGTAAGAAGGEAAASGQSAIDIIRNTPGYQFQTEQGTRALNASRSAGGTSGGALIKDFARFNQGLASNFYQDYANRLQNLASGGQSASANAGSFAIQAGGQMGQSIQNAGLARASGLQGISNNLAGISNSIFQGLGQRGAQPTINSGINTSTLGGTQGSSYNPFANLFPGI